jgi:hypothetical protein
MRAATLRLLLAPTLLIGASASLAAQAVSASTSRASTAAVSPTLGVRWASNATGFGQSHPRKVHYGGDGYSEITNITWSGWGTAKAIGHGTGWDVPAGGSQDQGHKAPATVVAYQLGSCNGHRAYESFGWYFAGDGGHFDPNYFIDACTGQLETARTLPCPTAATAYAAWKRSPGIYQAAPGTVTGFGKPQCWSKWVVATMEGNANGQAVLDQTPKLHGATDSELEAFDRQVCSNPAAPEGWKNPAAGPASCS